MFDFVKKLYKKYEAHMKSTNTVFDYFMRVVIAGKFGIGVLSLVFAWIIAASTQSFFPSKHTAQKNKPQTGKKTSRQRPSKEKPKKHILTDKVSLKKKTNKQKIALDKFKVQKPTVPHFTIEEDVANLKTNPKTKKSPQIIYTERLKGGKIAVQTTKGDTHISKKATLQKVRAESGKRQAEEYFYKDGKMHQYKKFLGTQLKEKKWFFKSGQPKEHIVLEKKRTKPNTQGGSQAEKKDLKNQVVYQARYHDNGQLKFEQFVNEKGIRERYWYKDGTESKVIHLIFHDGALIRHGKFTKWIGPQKVKAEGLYKHGLAVWTKTYDYIILPDHNLGQKCFVTTRWYVNNNRIIFKFTSCSYENGDKKDCRDSANANTWLQRKNKACKTKTP